MSRASQNHHKRKAKSRKLLWMIPAFLFVIIAGYIFGGTYYASRFESNTTINGVNVSGLTTKAATTKLENHYQDKNFTLKENGKSWKRIPFSELGITANYTDGVKNALDKQNQWAWGTSLFSKSKLKMDVTSLDEEKLKTVLANLTNEINALNEGRTQTQNATLVKTDAGFEIQKEVIGENVDAGAVIEAISAAVGDGKDSLELEDYRKKPDVTSDNEDLKNQEQSLNKIAKISANYSINGNTFQIPTATIMDWLKYENGQISLDNDKVTAYVTELGTKYDTYTNPTSFNSTLRGTVEVPAGTYSWTIQTAEETAALVEAIMKGEDFTRSPITLGATTADHALVGNTYIEVDLNAQHMWYYKDGNVVLETDIVSGLPSTPTPTGVFYIWSKESPSILRGTNSDGSKYATEVSYWMPIDNTGVGIHDSSWQAAYGGTRYLTYGSHGCINTPPDVVATLFNDVAAGTPVLVF